MPTLFFANPGALRLALASGVVPAGVSRSPARAGYDPQGRLWLCPDAPLHRDALAALARLGVQALGTSGAAETHPVDCWQQLLALEPAPVPLPFGRPVLFEVASDRLAELVGELRRLGRPSLRFRWLPEPPESDESPLSSVLLRVEEPPSYTLARVREWTDPPTGSAFPPRAYYEQAPRVWVEVGHAHPLAEQIQPPDGQTWLLRPPAVWALLDDGPFSRELSEWPLPTALTRLGDRPPPGRLPVRLCLVPTESPEPAELWVVREQPLAGLTALVRSLDDRLLGRLLIAVGEQAGRPCVVLRLRASRRPPPVLALPALSCRPLLKLPNLFVPCGHRLQPPLRRDVLRRLLADDPSRVAWLVPTEGGHFTVASVAVSAFRPLTDVVEYRTAAAATLTEWVQRPLFEPAPFAVAADESTSRPRSRGAPAEPAPAAPRPEEPGLISRLTGWLRKGTDAPPPAAGRAAETPPSLDEQLQTFLTRPVEAPAAGSGRRTAWQDRRQQLEARFLRAAGPLAADDRHALWPELAGLYTALNNPSDATLCWLNALWEEDGPAPLWAWGWLRAEATASHWSPAGGDVAALVAAAPTPAGVRTLAAYLVWSARQGPPPAALLRHLDRIQPRLEAHEAWLPVRAAWLAQVSLARLAGGDTLGLTRARDRLLARLHRHGLSLDQDLPSFLRFAGQGSSERYQTVRDWMMRSRDLIQRWVGRQTVREELPAGTSLSLRPFGLVPEDGTFTRAYVNLTLAWGLARLGELQKSNDWAGEAAEVLGRRDVVHELLLEAYQYRIGQALEGRPGQGSLPDAWLARLAALNQPGDARCFKIQGLREVSRILEPAERIDAGEPLSVDDPGPDEDVRRLRQACAGVSAAEAMRYLTAALKRAPRRGEGYARAVLSLVFETVDEAGGESAELGLLERGLFVVSHFDQADLAAPLVGHALRRLSGQRRPEELAELEAFGWTSLRGLRRLGLRAQGNRLLQRLAEWVLNGQDLAGLRAREPQSWPDALRALLPCAAAGSAPSEEAQAGTLLDEARRWLFAHGPTRERPDAPAHAAALPLARAYATALGQTSVRKALGRIEELFQRFQTRPDRRIANTHYALSPLTLVESVVLAIVHDDFVLGPVVRRWLDDDEFLVRQRISRDLRALASRPDAR